MICTRHLGYYVHILPPNGWRWNNFLKFNCPKKPPTTGNTVCPLPYPLCSFLVLLNKSQPAGFILRWLSMFFYSSSIPLFYSLFNNNCKYKMVSFYRGVPRHRWHTNEEEFPSMHPSSYLIPETFGTPFRLAGCRPPQSQMTCASVSRKKVIQNSSYKPMRQSPALKGHGWKCQPHKTKCIFFTHVKTSPL